MFIKQYFLLFIFVFSMSTACVSTSDYEELESKYKELKKVSEEQGREFVESQRKRNEYYNKYTYICNEKTVLNEKIKLYEDKISSLEEKIEELKDPVLAEFKVKIDLFKSELEEIKRPIDAAGGLVESIEKLRLNENMASLRYLYGATAWSIITKIDNIRILYEDFQKKSTEIGKQKERLVLIESDIQKKQEELDGMNGYEIKDLRVNVIRRYATEDWTQRGFYECVFLEGYRKIVLLAYEKEVKTDKPYKEIVVKAKYLGERPVIITKSNAFQSFETTEYLEHYEIVNENDPYYKKILELEDRKKSYSELKKIFDHGNEEAKLDFIAGLRNSILYLKNNL
jgi:hypothetical protein